MSVGVILLTAFLGIFLIALFLLRRPARTPPLYTPLPIIGAGVEFAKDPLGTVRRAHEAYGEIFTVRNFGFDMTFVVGPEATAIFMNHGDEELSTKEAYRFVVPVFGKGVVYDAPIERMNQQVSFIKTGLRPTAFEKNAPIMEDEARTYFRKWGNEGTVDLLADMNKLTILTASRCLLGNAIRGDPKVSEEFAALYHDLEGGLNPISFFFPNLPTPAHRKRDAARIEIQKLFSRIITERRAVPKDQQPDDMLNVFMNAVYRTGEILSDEQITGLLIGLLFAGQHTSGITATWTGFYLQKHRNFLKECLEEQAQIRAKYGEAITYEILRPENTPRLESCVREALRMHPPLIFLMRKVMKQLKYKNFDIPVGDLLCISPSVAMRLPSVYTNPDTFDPHRFDRGEDKAKPFSYLAFGGGKHGCPGERFGILQVKTIWCVLLRTFEFELVGDFPQPDYTNLVVGPHQPANIKHKRIPGTTL